MATCLSRNAETLRYPTQAIQSRFRRASDPCHACSSWPSVGWKASSSATCVSSSTGTSAALIVESSSWLDNSAVIAMGEAVVGAGNGCGGSSPSNKGSCALFVSTDGGHTCAAFGPLQQARMTDLPFTVLSTDLPSTDFVLEHKVRSAGQLGRPKLPAHFGPSETRGAIGSLKPSARD